MKKSSPFLLSAISFILLFAAIAGITAPVRTLASGSYALATPATPSSPPQIASPATPSVARKADMNETLYTLCGYNFWYSDGPMEWELGDSSGIEDELSYISTVDVYLDGPDGHMEEPLELDAAWDISQVDFMKEGDYTVTGTLDTSACEYPVDWNSTPAPSFTLRIIKGGVLSFQTTVSGDTLTLSYQMNGEPFLFSSDNFAFDLYESQDGGENWQNISKSNRVQITRTGIVVSGIASDSLFQMTELFLGGFFADSSDIVEIAGTPGNLSAGLIESGGEQGGGLWPPGENWDDTPILDGPYSILKYTTQNKWMNVPLEIPIERGNQDSLAEHKDYYDLVNVHYGDNSDGFWSRKVLLAVQWDWAAADDIDWNKTGDTVIHGSFSEETQQGCEVPLDFEHMPELTLTVSIYNPEPDLISFTLDSTQQALLEGNTVEFLFCDASFEPITFADISGLTLWCSTDTGENWYDITESPNVSLGHDRFSVSGLKDSILRSKNGYAFQAEQKSHSDYSEFSNIQTVIHDVMWGITISSIGGGERGGGKRHEKPPEGLFDSMESGEEETETTPPETETAPPVTESAPPETETTPPVTESAPPETETTPPVTETAPPETETAPPVTETAPPETGTVPPVTGNASPEAGTAAPDATTIPDSSTAPLETATVPSSTLPGADIVPTEAIHEAEKGKPKALSETVKASLAVSPAMEADSPTSSPETDASTASAKASSTTQENVETSGDEPEASREAISKAAVSPNSSSHGTLRVLLSTAAVLTGAAAGFWMIRRR